MAENWDEELKVQGLFLNLRYYLLVAQRVLLTRLKTYNTCCIILLTVLGRRSFEL